MLEIHIGIPIDCDYVILCCRAYACIYIYCDRTVNCCCVDLIFGCIFWLQVQGLTCGKLRTEKMFLTPTLWVFLQDPARRIRVRHASSRPVVVTHPTLGIFWAVQCRIGLFVGIRMRYRCMHCTLTRLYIFMDLCIFFVMLFVWLILGDLGVSLVSIPGVVCLRRGTVASHGRGVWHFGLTWTELDSIKCTQIHTNSLIDA